MEPTDVNRRMFDEVHRRRGEGRTALPSPDPQCRWRTLFFVRSPSVCFTMAGTIARSTIGRILPF